MRQLNSPSPIPKRICPCGCELEFQPGRRDQIYFNNKHANYGYNHGKRKERDANSSILKKMIDKNDRILRFFYEQKQEEHYLTRLTSLTDSGFKTGVYPAKKEIKDETYFFMYNFKYRLIQKEEEWFVQISKMSKIK